MFAQMHVVKILFNVIAQLVFLDYFLIKLCRPHILSIIYKISPVNQFSIFQKKPVRATSHEIDWERPFRLTSIICHSTVFFGNHLSRKITSSKVVLCCPARVLMASIGTDQGHTTPFYGASIMEVFAEVQFVECHYFMSASSIPCTFPCT